MANDNDKAPKKDADTKPDAAPKGAQKAETRRGQEAMADTKKDSPKPPYVVAKGRSVTSTRGILAEGAEVKASDFPGGEDRLAELRKAGVVEKTK